MPHECVECGEVFDDGADEVFEGCPDCGATKFFYVKEVGATEDAAETEDAEEQSTAQTPQTPQEAESPAQKEARRAVGSVEDNEPDAADEEASVSTVTEDSGTEPDTEHATHKPDTEPVTKNTVETQTATPEDDDIVEAESEYERSFGGKLDNVVEASEADDTPTEAESDQITSSDGRRYRRARPAEAKRRLMDEFETIRIVEPGSYELNLMNLYEEDEKIIALQEDGRYQVSLPSTIDD
ncbi:MAG: Zn-ribbon containing protein [Halobacteriales archaeon]|nr:Zn-ribbon containing protein [Halobacteriales archaeon]